MKKSVMSLSFFSIALSLALIAFAGDDIPVSPPSKPSTARCRIPVPLSAKDLITKIYGIVPAGLPRRATMDQVALLTGCSPRQEDSLFWLGSADGFRISYFGLDPDLEAFTRFDGDSLRSCAFFFIFPYETGARYKSMVQQTVFSSSILQEMQDIGMDLSADSLTDGIFEAQGSLCGKMVVIRLSEETVNPRTDTYSEIGPLLVYDRNSLPPAPGRFVLAMTVTP